MKITGAEGSTETLFLCIRTDDAASKTTAGVNLSAWTTNGLSDLRSVESFRTEKLSSACPSPACGDGATLARRSYVDVPV